MKHPPNFQWVDLHPKSLRPHTQGQEVALSHHGLHDKVHCWLAAWLAAWLAGWLAGWLVSWPSAEGAVGKRNSFQIAFGFVSPSGFS